MSSASHGVVEIDFDEMQGIWHIRHNDTQMASTGLARALGHVGAMFGVGEDAVVVRVDETIDALIVRNRLAEGSERLQLLQQAVDHVFTNEIPLGAHDFCTLFECDHDTVDAMFAAK